MTQNELYDSYLDWMYQLVCNDKYSRGLAYCKLFRQLYETEFDFTLPMDANRAEDGIDLRYRFGVDQGYDDCVIASYLDDRACSVLEMMIALAIRCETHFMDDPDVGDRTGQWFWEMVVNLKLGHMTDRNYDEDYVDDVMYHFLNREYGSDGEGGLFKVKNPPRDMRSVDIWYQMCWYLNDVIDGKV